MNSSGNDGNEGVESLHEKLQGFYKDIVGGEAIT